MKRALLSVTAALVLAAPSARAGESFVAERSSYAAVQRGLLLGLGAWGTTSLAAGGALLAADPLPAMPGNTTARRRSFQRGLAASTLGFAAVNLALAALALARGPVRPALPSELDSYRTGNQRLYAVNVGADMLYVGLGCALWAEGPSPFWRGFGAGSASQGAFLVGFDAAGATLARR